MVPYNFCRGQQVRTRNWSRKWSLWKNSTGLEKVKPNPEVSTSSFRLRLDVGWVSTNNIDSVRAASPELLSICTLGSRSQAAWAACSWYLEDSARSLVSYHFNHSFLAVNGGMTNTNVVIPAIDDSIDYIPSGMKRCCFHTTREKHPSDPEKWMTSLIPFRIENIAEWMDTGLRGPFSFQKPLLLTSGASFGPFLTPTKFAPWFFHLGALILEWSKRIIAIILGILEPK